MNTSDGLTPLDRIQAFRGQVQAAQLAKAVRAGDAHTAEHMYCRESDAGLMRELVAGLVTGLLSFAQTCEANTDLDAAELLEAFENHATTGLAGTADIENMTNPNDDAGDQK